MPDTRFKILIIIHDLQRHLSVGGLEVWQGFATQAAAEQYAAHMQLGPGLVAACQGASKSLHDGLGQLSAGLAPLDQEEGHA